MTTMHTASGRLVDPFNLSAGDVCLEDIAHHLAHTCRFNGATPVYYSVAEHACRVANLVEYHHGPEAALLALHHDDAEAYLGDQIRPIKSRLFYANGVCGYDDDMPELEPFDNLEDSVMGAIFRALFTPEQIHFEAEIRHRIKAADNAQLAAELRCFWGKSAEADALDPVVKTLYPMNRWSCMPPKEAKALFLTEHERLVGRVEKHKRRAERLAAEVSA